MKRKALILLITLLMCPFSSICEDLDLESMSLEDLSHLQVRVATEVENRIQPSSVSIVSVPVEITLVEDQYIYCGSQEEYRGIILPENKCGYCLIPAEPGEQYTITTGSRIGVVPVVWYATEEIGHDAYIDYINQNETPASSLYQEKLTVPNDVHYMLIQTSNMETFPITIEKDTIIKNDRNNNNIVVNEQAEQTTEIDYAPKDEPKSSLNAHSDCRLEIAYNNKSGTASIPCGFSEGEQVICHLKPLNGVSNGNKLSSEIAKYYAVNSQGIETLIAADYAYNYPIAIIPADTVEIKVSFPPDLSGKVEVETLVFCVYSMAMPRQPHIITVDAKGHGNFLTLRQALDSITDSDMINRYEIHISPGIYNILDDYTQEEISADGFIGPIVGEGITLVGVGAGRENIILHGELDPSLYKSQKRNDISTLNVVATCELRNLTITAKNIRYAIHDDLGQSGYQTCKHSFIDCIFRGDFLTSGDIGSRAFGAGGAHLKQYYFNNCIFQDMLYIHTDENSTGYPSCVIENCTAKIMAVRDVNSGKNAYFHLSNNNFGMIIYRTSGGHDQFIHLSSSGECSPFIYASVPFVYEIGDTMRFINTGIDAGYAVAMDSTMNASVTGNVENMIGISLGQIDGDTIVLRSGYVDGAMFGLQNLSIGDYVGIDDTGKIVYQENAEGAIGKVERILGAENHPFIHLSF